MQVPHSRYPNSRALPGVASTLPAGSGTEDGGNPSCCARPQRMHGCGRDSSAGLAGHLRLIIVGHSWCISSGGTWGRRRHVYPPVCPAPLQWPARHTPHDPRMLPALCASTDGTRGRPHRDWGVCARTLRQRPAGRRLRKPGIALFVRPVINSAYLVRHHVLLHPIRRQEPHPISYHQGILCQGFSDRWDRCGDT